MRKRAALFLTWASLLAAPGAFAVPIPGLVSTGLGTSGTLESNWTLLAGTAWITDQTSFPFPPWLPNTSSSAWISPQRSYAGLLSDPAGALTFTLLFNLTGYIPSTATFTYRLAADNSISVVRLNGNSIGGGGVAGFTSFSLPFVVGPGSGAFAAGVNTLEVVLVNAPGATGNPTGLRFEVLSSNVDAIPEPSFGGAVGLALVAAWYARRR
jgi:hypothetical protein